MGLIQLGLKPNVTLAVPNQGRLDTIIDLIDESDFSIHDLSRIEPWDGVPRFNIPLELGLALYRARASRGKHRVFIFGSKAYRALRSTSDINGIDPYIHEGNPNKLMARLRDIFRQPGDTTTVPEMLASYRAVKRKLPIILEQAGGGSIFEAAVFKDIAVVALLDFQRRIQARTSKKPR